MLQIDFKVLIFINIYMYVKFYFIWMVIWWDGWTSTRIWSGPSSVYHPLKFGFLSMYLDLLSIEFGWDCQPYSHLLHNYGSINMCSWHKIVVGVLSLSFFVYSCFKGITMVMKAKLLFLSLLFGKIDLKTTNYGAGAPVTTHFY